MVSQKKEESYTLSIISIICGLIGIFTTGFILGLIGLILGVIAWRKKENKVLYIIGITTSAIAFITSTMFWVSIGKILEVSFVTLGNWCGQRDSNSHGESSTWPSTKPVYQFQHSRICVRISE